MKIHIYGLLLTASLLATSAQADCSLGAPGVPVGTQVMTKVPFQKDVNLPGCYKFVFCGSEAKGNTTGGYGAPSGGGNGNTPSQHSSSYNNGYNSGYNNGCSQGYDDGYNDGYRNRSHHRRYEDDDDIRHRSWYWGYNSYNSGYYAGYECGYNWSYDYGYDNGCNRNSVGTLSCKATVTDDKTVPKTCSNTVQFNNVSDFNNSSLKTSTISPACVYRATTTPMVIKLTWKCEGSAPKPNGTFNILAEYQKDPPPPTGSLNFAVGDWALQASSTAPRPDGIAKIVRE